jgi:soluble lytic murein transglycosylase-like protein
MANLKPWLIALMTVRASVAGADPVEHFRREISDAASRFGLPEQWIRRVITIESGGRTMIDGKKIVSPAGAMGLMQLMPGTWRDMQALLRLGPDPFDPHDNIVAGVAYLRILYDRFGFPGLFAAYNAGPERYSKYLAHRQNLPAETRAYLSAATEPRALPTRKPSPAVLFVLSNDALAQKARDLEPANKNLRTLFVELGNSNGH